MSALVSKVDVEAFYNGGMEQFDQLLIGEGTAKIGMLVAMVSGLNVVFVGEPGGGKTTLATNAHRIVDGIDPKNVADIPPLPDLAPQQLVGGNIEHEKQIVTDGIERREKTLTVIEGIVKPTTQVLVANEINRVNPDALDGVLEAFESGLLTTTAGNVQMDDYVYGVATMNPSERHEGTAKLAKAMTSRFAIGSVLGSDEPTNDLIIINALKGKGAWKSNPDKVETVTKLETLRAMRKEAAESIAIPADLADSEFAKLKRVNSNLRALGNFSEAPGRFVTRTLEVAKTLAYLRRKDELDEQDMLDAKRYLVTARIGIQGTGATGKSVHDLTEDILAA